MLRASTLPERPAILCDRARCVLRLTDWRWLPAYPGRSDVGQATFDAVGGSVACLEVCKLAHEGRRNIGVDLAVEEERTFRLPQLGRNPVQVLERADGRGLEAEPLGDWGEVNIREHGLAHRLLPEPQEVKLGAIGTIVHHHDH